MDRSPATTDGADITGLTQQETVQLDDSNAWSVLRPLLDLGPYLPWSSGALRPSALVAICNDIVLSRRTRVVECGSGASTVVLARLLREQAKGGTLVALEHDAHWVELVTDLLRRESLDTIAQVVHAPLEGEPVWYSRTALSQLPESIDLLVVDGPPAFAPGLERRRAPALGALDARLSANASVFLDDVDRPGEQAVLADWTREFAWTFAINNPAGIASGTRNTERWVVEGGEIGLIPDSQDRLRR